MATDYTSGSTGDDEIYGEDGNDQIASFSGSDFLEGGEGNDVLIGGDGADALLGDAGNDELSSGDGDDYLIGDEGRDVLKAGNGDDTLEGGPGNDRLEGGNGYDRFVFNSPLDASENVDTIADFVVSDDLMLLTRGIFPVSDTLVAGALPQQAFRLGRIATAEADRIVYDPANGWLYYDLDGNGEQAAIHFATLSPGLALASTNFIISER